MKKTTQWFTVLELIFVMTILFIISITYFSMMWNSYFTGRQAVYNTALGVDTKVQNQLRYAMSWYWDSLVTSSGERDNKNLLPSDYVVFFQSSVENDEQWWHFYLINTQDRKNTSSKYTRVVKREKQEYLSPEIFLKRIVAKNTPTDVWVVVPNISISFKNPTWKQEFYVDHFDLIRGSSSILWDDVGNTIHEYPYKTPNASYALYVLEFVDNNGNLKFTYTITNNKKFYIDNED